MAWRWLRRAAGAACLGVLALYAWEVASRAQLEAPTATPILYDRNGTYLTQIRADGGSDARSRKRGANVQYDAGYGYWPLEAVPERVARATLALEDRRFAAHPGVDVQAMGRASWQWLSRARRRTGASTIAMQTARMQRPAARNLWAKAVEAGTGLILTARYGREEVLKHYLRLVPYGNGSHGIAHAARFYFAKPVADLSWAEIALLSAIPQSPTLMNPMHPMGLYRAKLRGHRILKELARLGVIGEAECALALEQLSDITMPAPPRRPDALHAILRYEALVRDGAIRPMSAFDPRIRTTLDLAMQESVTEQARSHLDSWRVAGAQQTAVMVVERGSRNVVAYIGSAEYRDRNAGAIDFGGTIRSPGSSLKPFIYALALDRSVLKPADVLADLPEGASGVGNADGTFLGPMLPRQALANSRNVPATNLLRTVGLEAVYGFFRNLGLHELDAPADNFGLSMAIGSLPTSLERLVRAYSALAEDGLLGDLAWAHGQERETPARVLSIDSARLITSFLSDPLARLPSFPRYGSTEYPFPVALKTGTSQAYRDAWIVAYSTKYIVGVWIGRSDAGPMNALTGARAAAPLAKAVLMRLHSVLPGDIAEAKFPPPDGRAAIELCVIGGKRSNGQCGQTLTEWLRPAETPPLEEAGTVAQSQLRMAVPAVYRAWAKEEGFPVDERAGAGAPVHLSISAPEHNSRIWRNPEAPQALNRLALKVVVEPRATQVVWYVDGEPFAISDSDQAVLWPMKPGAHRFQVRLPLQRGASRVVRVVVE